MFTMFTEGINQVQVQSNFLIDFDTTIENKINREERCSLGQVFSSNSRKKATTRIS